MKLTFEATNVCPLPCHDNKQNPAKRSIGIMEIATYKAALQHFNKFGIENIEFGGCGESLLSPNIREFISLGKILSPKSKITLVTNGLLLTPKLCQDLTKAGLNSISIILSPSHIPLTFPQRGSEKGRLYENITLVSKLCRALKIIHSLPQWSSEQRDIVSKFWKLRSIPKVFFGKRLACGTILDTSIKQTGHRPPLCSLFRSEYYISHEGDLLSCCHDESGETSLGNIKNQLILSLVEKKQRIVDKQYFYPICYECIDDRRKQSKSIVKRLFNSVFQT